MIITMFTLLKWLLLAGGLLTLVAGLIYWLVKHAPSATWPFRRLSTQPLHSVDMSTLETAHYEAAQFKPAAPPARTTAHTTATGTHTTEANARPARFTLPVRPTARVISLHPPDRAAAQPIGLHPPDRAAAQPSSLHPPDRTSTTGILDKLRAMDWFRFQKVIFQIYEKQGYTVTRTGGVNPDGGIDLFIEKDGVRGAVQCKPWTQWKIQALTVREFVGAMYLEGIEQGVMIIPGGCTAPAQSLADEQRIKILGEADLGRMLEAVAAGTDQELLGLINDRRKLCPKCESELVLRSARANPGQHFWGCSTYPRCDYNRPVTEAERASETVFTAKAL
jgi:hypothetical protein